MCMAKQQEMKRGEQKVLMAKGLPFCLKKLMLCTAAIEYLNQENTMILLVYIYQTNLA